VRVAVVADLMIRRDYRVALLTIGLDHNARDEEGCEMPRRLSSSRMRPTPTTPNSPRETGVGVVNPRAVRPDHASKSNVAQTIWRGMGRELFLQVDALADL